MAELREELKKLKETLLQQRDELRLKLHLTKADARNKWKELGRK